MSPRPLCPYVPLLGLALAGVPLAGCPTPTGDDDSPADDDSSVDDDDASGDDDASADDDDDASPDDDDLSPDDDESTAGDDDSSSDDDDDSTGCADDSWEENDDELLPAIVGAPQDLPGLQACPFDDDWFGFDLALGDDTTITIAYDPSEGDLNLEVLDPDGDVVASSSETDGDDTVQFFAMDNGTFLVHVIMYTEMGSVPGVGYDLSMSVTPNPSNCLDDALEDNDDPLSYSFIAAPSTTSSLQACFDDDDWYLSYLTGGTEVTVDVLFSQAEGDIELQVFDAFANLIGSSTSADDDESLTFAVPSSGGYAFWVYLVTDFGVVDGNSYELDVSVYTPPTTCVDDAYEDNDSPAAPTLLAGPGNLSSLVGCPFDDDWYAIPLSGGDSAEVSLSFSSADGDLDLEVWDSLGNLQGSGNTSGDGEIVSFTVPADGTYAIHALFVSDAGPTEGVPYQIDVVTTPPVLSPCVPDANEEDDDFGSATPTGSGSFSGLTACPSDVDLFEISLGSGQTLTANLSWDSAEGTLGASLGDASGIPVGSSSPTGGGLQVSYTATGAGTFYLGVDLVADLGLVDGAEYELDITIGSASVCSPDANEEDDTQAAATPTSDGSYSGFTICPGDDDWFSFALTTNETLQVDVLFSNLEGNIDLQLYNVSSTLLADSASTDDDEQIIYVAPSAMTVYLRVSLPQDSGSTLGNSYSMVVAAAISTCAADSYEENDDPMSPSVVFSFPFSETGLTSCPGDDDYYAMYLAAGDTITIDVAFLHAEGNIDVYLSDSVGTPVATSLSTDDDEQIVYTSSGGGNYAVRVTLAQDLGSSAGNEYDLDISLSSAPPPTCTDDSYEENDSATDYELLSVEGNYSLQACDDDWFAWGLFPNQNLTATVTYNPSQIEIDLELINGSTFQIVCNSSLLTGTETCSWTAPASGAGLAIHVIHQFDPDSTPGGTYTLNINVTP
jgi:hypothetical protein